MTDRHEQDETALTSTGLQSEASGSGEGSGTGAANHFVSLVIMQVAESFVAVVPYPTGTIDFFLYSDAACTEAVGSDVNVALNANGEATSKFFNITASDTYYWQVHYDGDTN